MAENSNSDCVKTGSKSFGSLKKYWENMSNQRMETDYSVPSRTKVDIIPKLCTTKLKEVRIQVNCIKQQWIFHILDI